MSNRLSPVDVSYLYLEESTTAMNIGSVLVFERPAEFEIDTLITHLGDRLAYAPRYRKRLKWVPAHLANPLWVDDTRFELSNHVFRSALPQPGTPEQLGDLVARLLASPLDRARPLWQVYVVEGLEDGGFAVVTKSHQALVDGVNALELSQVILDRSENATPSPPDSWAPDREPSLIELVTGAFADAVRRPSQVVETVRPIVDDLRTSSVGTAFTSVLNSTLSVIGNARPAPDSPLNVGIGKARRFATLDTQLDDYRQIRDRLKASRRRAPETISINDVMLATIAGGLREWLLTRGATVESATLVRALVPLRVRVHAGADSTSDPAFLTVPLEQLEAALIDLPVGEPNPVVRLQQIAFETKAHAETGRGVPARALASIGGFGPATVHSSAARLASRASRLVFNLLITNVPGPQHPLYAAGARLQRGYPVIPLMRRQALAIGLTSYDGGVYYGLNADRDAMPDVGLLSDCIGSSLEELHSALR